MISKCWLCGHWPYLWSCRVRGHLAIKFDLLYKYRYIIDVNLWFMPQVCPPTYRLGYKSRRRSLHLLRTNSVIIYIEISLFEFYIEVDIFNKYKNVFWIFFATLKSYFLNIISLKIILLSFLNTKLRNSHFKLFKAYVSFIFLCGIIFISNQ